MKKSKKGITLVELVICCGIIVLLGGACTAVLLSGERVFSSSSNMANTQMEANVLQTFLLNRLPLVKEIEETNIAAATTKVSFEDIEGDKQLTILSGGTRTVLGGVSSFRYSYSKAGDAVSTTARTMLNYTATMDDGSSFSGGLLLGNIVYDDDIMEDASGNSIEFDLETNPLAFDVPAPAGS